MKKAVVAIAQIVGYLAAFVIVTIVIMGMTKMFIGDWEAGGPILDLFGESLLTTIGLALTNVLIFLLARSSGIFRGWPPPRASIRSFAFGALLGLAMAGTMLILLHTYFRRRGVRDLPIPLRP